MSNRKERKIADIVLVLFVALLVGLGLGFSSGTTMSSENRALAKFPSICVGKGVNWSFPSELECWLNDRIGFRNELIDVSHLPAELLPGRYLKVGKYVWDRESGWIWRMEGTRAEWKESFIRDVAEELVEFRDWLREKGAELWFLLVPQRTVVYRRQALEMHADEIGEGSVEKLTRVLTDALGDRFLCPIEQLQKAAEREQVFYKTSHHWSEYGAFVGWRELAERICVAHGMAAGDALHESSYRISVDNLVREDSLMFSRKSRSIGQYAKMLGFSDDDYPQSLLSTPYAHYFHKHQGSLKGRRTAVPGLLPGKRARYVGVYPRAAPLRTLVLGTSHTNVMLPFMPYTFSPLEFIRINGGQVEERRMFCLRQLYGREFDSFKPDVVILCLSMPNLFSLHKINKE